MRRVVAVDLGATNVRVARIREDGTLDDLRKETVRGLEGDEITEKIATLIAETADRTCEAIGISTAGPVDLGRGCVVHSPNMHAAEIKLTKPLAETCGMPVKMLTDCKAGVLGEYRFGAGKSCRNLAYITISSGIGCGVLEDGMLIAGADGNAGEAGHFIVDTAYNLPCGCGGNGHWECYCSGANIPKFFAAWCKRHDKPCSETRTEQILAKAADGAEPYASFAAEIKRFNAAGIQSVICAYNPERIVLDGPVALNHRWLFSDLKTSYLRRPELVFSSLDGNAPLLGAAAYAFE
ncbi:MAG TPA: ROK family protein [Methanocorpusculum sp.]|nr:ROK family protein [Methanocorpusculum sp.]